MHYNTYMGYTYTKKRISCLSEISISLGILNFNLLNPATLNESHFKTLPLLATSILSVN